MCRSRVLLFFFLGEGGIDQDQAEMSRGEPSDIKRETWVWSPSGIDKESYSLSESSLLLAGPTGPVIWGWLHEPFT